MARARGYTGQPGTSSAAIITASASQVQTVTAATVTNPTASAATLSIWIVPASASAVDANILYDAFSVDAGAMVGLPLLVGQSFGSGDAIHAAASAATALTLHISVDR